MEHRGSESWWLSLRGAVLWCLLVALPVYGLSATLVPLLGSMHLHHSSSAESDPMAGWQDFRRAVHATTVVPQPHSHSIFQRHHHAHDDASVLSLDHAASDTSSSPEGSSSSGNAATLVLAMVSPPALPGTPDRRDAWRDSFKFLPTSQDLLPLERPPRS